VVIVDMDRIDESNLFAHDSFFARATSAISRSTPPPARYLSIAPNALLQPIVAKRHGASCGLGLFRVPAT